MLDVDEGGGASLLLRLRYYVQRDGRFAGAFRAVDLDYAPSRNAADAKSEVKCDGAGGDGFNVQRLGLSEGHNGTLSELFFYLADCGFQRSFFVRHIQCLPIYKK